MYRSIPKPPIPPRQTPGQLTFLKNFGQIPRYVASLDDQMPHPLELQRGSNPPPSRHVTHEITNIKQHRLPNKFCKNFSHYEFLAQLVYAPHFKQRVIPRYNYINRQQQKNPGRNRRPVSAAHELNQRITETFCFRPLTDVLTRKSNAPAGVPHFGSNSLLYGAQLMRVKCPGIARGGMGGFGIDWYITTLLLQYIPLYDNYITLTMLTTLQ